MKRVLSLAALLFASMPSAALANFHQMKVVEVFAGSTLAPNAQYVVIQMWFDGQTVVGGHSIIVSNASGTAVGTFTFSGSVTNGTSQDRILIATADAQALFNITPDLVMPSATIPAAGGRVCFDAIDCVAWGSFPVSGMTGNPESPRLGIRAGQALIRRLDIVPSPTTLENADDTNDSANDFIVGTPAPRNNARVSGTVPPSTCANGVTEGLEQCDDEMTGTSGDGCASGCMLEVCGDGVTNNDGAEACDDGNLSNTDDCTNVCANAICGDTFVRAGVEVCDDGNSTNTDSCVGCANATCGDGFVRSGVENCDEGASLNGMATHCNLACTGLTGTVCGNSIPESGEVCDTGGASASCDADCTAVSCGDETVNSPAGETCDDGAGNGMPNACNATCNGTTNATCGNGIVESSETCDDGASNGMPNACNAACNGTTTPVCGNSVVEGAEGCDEGTTNGTDHGACDATCSPVAHHRGGGGGCTVSPRRSEGALAAIAVALVFTALLRRRRV